MAVCMTSLAAVDSPTCSAISRASLDEARVKSAVPGGFTKPTSCSMDAAKRSSGVYFYALNLAESATELVGTVAVVQQREGQYADRMRPRFSS
jgi:hypothetical protein